MNSLTFSQANRFANFSSPVVGFPQISYAPAYSPLPNPIAYNPMLAQMITLNQQFLNSMVSLLVTMLGSGMASANPAASSPMASMFPSLVSNSPAGGTSGAAPTMASSGTPSGGPKVKKFIDSALSKQGSPYVFGAAGPDKFDCSGLVSWALKQAGSNVPRLTAEGYRQRYANSSVGKNDLKPGDLIFYYSPNDRGIAPGHATHIEIYLGNGMTMGTDNPKEGARVEPINWKTFIGAARPPELQG